MNGKKPPVLLAGRQIRSAWWLKRIFLGIGLLVVLWCIGYPLLGPSISFHLEKKNLALARSNLDLEQLRAWALSQIPTQIITNDLATKVVFDTVPQALIPFTRDSRRCSIYVSQGDAIDQHMEISWRGDSGYWRLRIGSTNFNPQLNAEELLVEKWAQGICLSYQERVH
jgi:hypothetical protein